MLLLGGAGAFYWNGKKVSVGESQNMQKPVNSTSNTLDTLFNKYGTLYNIPPALLKAIATVESTLNPNAKNPTSSAKGLMQVVDATARDMGEDPNKQYDPETSIRTGAKYIAWLVRSYNFNLNSAVKAYYAGAGTIRIGDRGGEFTQSWQKTAYQYAQASYLPKVMGHYERYLA